MKPKRKPAERFTMREIALAWCLVSMPNRELRFHDLLAELNRIAAARRTKQKKEKRK